MSGRRRIKTIAYDEDEFWDDDTDYSEEEDAEGYATKAHKRDGTVVQTTAERGMRGKSTTKTIATGTSGGRSSVAKQPKDVPGLAKRGLPSSTASGKSQTSSASPVKSVVSQALMQTSSSKELCRNTSMATQEAVTDTSCVASVRKLEDNIKRETVNDDAPTGESAPLRTATQCLRGASFSPAPASLHNTRVAGHPSRNRGIAGEEREAELFCFPPLGRSVEQKSLGAGTNSLLQAPPDLRTPPSVEALSAADRVADAGKSSYSLVVIGHVDAGKSTLTGQLLFRTGAVNERQVEKMKRMSAAAGKGSFFYAWLCDEGDDERQRGVTIDVSYRVIVTMKEHRRICFLDAPGHHELVSNMLGGAVLADVALLVVDAARLETGFEGQTREHLLIARSLSIQHFAVAVNKMDEVGWSEKAYNDVMQRVRTFLTGPEIGCSAEQIYFVPVSALVGVNLVSAETPEGLQLHTCDGNMQKNSAHGQKKGKSVWNREEVATQTRLLRSWWKGPSLLELLEDIQVHTLAAQRQLSNEPFTASVADVWSLSSSSEELNISFRVASGCLRVGDKVSALPANVTFLCKALSSYGVEQKSCTAGDFVEKAIFAHAQAAPPIDKNTPSAGVEAVDVGTVMCTSMRSLRVVSSFFCKVIVFSRELPLMPGRQLVAYIHTMTCQCIVRKVVAIIDKKTGKAVKQKQMRRCALVCGMRGILEIDVSPVKICVRAKKDQDGQTSVLSRLVLRDRTGTAAAGIIVEDVEALDS